jgi:alkylation response protein AidB-like acyl-CoA dehydrogenase
MINLLPSDDQLAISNTISDFLRDSLPVERFRDAMAAKEASDRIWGQLAELGCFAISLDEAAGGIGLTLAEEAMAFRAYGRHVLSLAVLGTVLGARVAAASGMADLAGQLAAGGRRCGVGLKSPRGIILFDARGEDLVLLWDDSGARLYEVSELGDTRVEACIDEALMMTVSDGLPAEPLAQVGAHHRIADIAALLIAASQTGLIDGTCEMAVEYAKSRMQFGQPIGAFQAIKHKCADIGLASEMCWSQTAIAALSLAEATPDAPFQTANAQMISFELALDCARKNIQIHGGMGFTAEINAHYFLKRAHVLGQLGGGMKALRGKVLTLEAA